MKPESLILNLSSFLKFYFVSNKFRTFSLIFFSSKYFLIFFLIASFTFVSFKIVLFSFYINVDFQDKFVTGF